MSYMPGLGRAMSDLLESSAENEELNAELNNKEFVAKIENAYKIALLIVSVFGVGLGLPMFIWLGEWVALIFLCLGCCGLLVLPSLFTWRCTVNSISMTEECFIFFIKYKKIFYGMMSNIKNFVLVKTRVSFFIIKTKRD